MTQAETVTAFKIRTYSYETPFGRFDRRDEAEARCRQCDMDPKEVMTCRVDMSTVRALLAALNDHLDSLKLVPDEYGFNLSPCLSLQKHEPMIPGKYWRLIAFTTEGTSEGYYVHVGAIIRAQHGDGATYHDFGFAKTYGADGAYQIGREAQRFLTAAEWN